MPILVCMYDVIVVGARVAGASTALLLARRGYRVLLLDRARFPSDTLSTHYIHQPGVARLARWGVLDAVRETGCPALDRIVYRVADVRLAGSAPAVEGQRAAYAPRRYLLDAVLIDAAVAAGAEFREGSPVYGPVFDGDRVAGVEVRTPGGARARESALLCIGADGMRSGFAEAVGSRFTVRDPLLTCAHYGYWTGLRSGFELYEQPERWVGAVPTNDGATLIAVYRPQREFGAVRRNALACYVEGLRSAAPGLYERAAAGERVERLRGTGDQRNFFRQPAGPGWALVGDAAHHKDSITARGISDAFLQAELMAEAVGAVLHDPVRLDVRLRNYARRLADELDEGYRNALSVGRLEITPERLDGLREVAGSAELTERYFGVAAGALSLAGLYAA